MHAVEAPREASAPAAAEPGAYGGAGPVRGGAYADGGVATGGERQLRSGYHEKPSDEHDFLRLPPRRSVRARRGRHSSRGRRLDGSPL